MNDFVLMVLIGLLLFSGCIDSNYRPEVQRICKEEGGVLDPDYIRVPLLSRCHIIENNRIIKEFTFTVIDGNVVIANE